MPTHLFHIPVWPRSSRPHPKPRRFTFAPRHIAKHDDNLELNPASFHGSWGRQPSVELHLPITARAFICDEIDDKTTSLSPIANTLSPMSAAIEALTNAAANISIQPITTTTATAPAPVPPKPVEQPSVPAPAKPVVQQPVAATTTTDIETSPIPPARPLTPTTTSTAPIPVVMPVIPSPIIESDTPPLTPMTYITPMTYKTLPHSPPPPLPPSPTPVTIHIPASPSPTTTRVPPSTPNPIHHTRTPSTPINPIPLHPSSHILNRITITSTIKPIYDKTLQINLPPLHYQPSTQYQPIHTSTPYQSSPTPSQYQSSPLHCLCSSSPCSHIIDINTTHGYLYPSPTYSELSSFRSNIPSPIVSEHITPTHSRSSSRLIYTTPTHTRTSSRCNDTPTHARCNDTPTHDVYPSSWFNWRVRSMSMDACSPHHGIQSF